METGSSIVLRNSFGVFFLSGFSSAYLSFSTFRNVILFAGVSALLFTDFVSQEAGWE